MDKPYNIHEPLALTGERVRPLCATMWMFSRISTSKRKEGRRTFFEQREIERVILVDAQCIPASNNNIVSFLRTGDGTGSISFPGRADVKGVADDTPGSQDIEAGGVAIEMDDVHRLLANQSGNISSAADVGDLQILNVRSGKIEGHLLFTKSRRLPHHLKLLENEIVRQFGIGPKPESIHLGKRNVAHGKVSRWYSTNLLSNWN